MVLTGLFDTKLTMKPMMKNGPLVDRSCVGDVVVQIYDTVLLFQWFFFNIDAILNEIERFYFAVSGLNPRIRIILPNRYRQPEVYTIEFGFNARALEADDLDDKKIVTTIKNGNQRRKTQNKENIVNLYLMNDDVDSFVPNIVVSVRVCVRLMHCSFTCYFLIFFH